jgi:hypothetical protein
MSNTNTKTNAITTNFDSIHVSKGFVRGLQGQVLRLEQIQQSLIQQLDHANKLASEYHASAVTWQNEYDQALHEMDEVKQTLEKETMLRISREQELEYFKSLLQEQVTFNSNSRSPCPDHPHRHPDRYFDQYQDPDPMSPVSVASLSPRTFASRLQTKEPMMLLDPDTPKSEDDNDNDYQDDGGEDNETDDETKREFYLRYLYESSRSETTDCSGDPICHSDSD